MDFLLDGLPSWARPFVSRTIEVTRADSRFVGLMLGGSATTGAMDEFSDLDLVLVCRPAQHAALLAELPRLAARLGPLLACFTGEHVGEPRLLIALYGPAPVHVDLKLVADADLDRRVEDGVIVWQRDGALSAALTRVQAVWPHPDPQWIEDRFWIWVHYAATKIGRGELFECLDALAFLRSAVFGPLIAVANGHRPQGARRLERIAPGVVPALAATVGDHTAAGCLTAVRAAVDLYREMRDRTPGLTRRSAAENASVGYLADIAARFSR
jgi:hypothetical protein